MPKRIITVFIICIISILFIASAFSAEGYKLKRELMPIPKYKTIPSGINGDQITIKLKEGMGQPEFIQGRFQKSGQEWDKLNTLIKSNFKASTIKEKFDIEKTKLDNWRAEGIRNTGAQLADLTLYYDYVLPATLTEQERIAKLDELNALDIVEIAYFPPKHELATITKFEGEKSASSVMATPNYQSGQYYLNAAPEGIDAYYAWQFPGGKGDNVKVIDIEGNWSQEHEDLHGGVDNFHIAGTKLGQDWKDHGTAVLGEIAADSNGFGMTGIAFNADLGTVSIGSMSVANALLTCINNSDTGDVFLIELHAPGPHYNFESREDQKGYVCEEYWQENFDMILQASSLKRIVVEAAGNGAENFDDTNIYGSLFDPNFRFSGAILVGASYSYHYPAPFTNYGERVDVHAFGTWDVYSLGYGDLHGTSNADYYTSSFSGTSSASPIITGSCAVLQGVSKSYYGKVLDHTEMRRLLTEFSTPQSPSTKNIGPLPDLAGGVDELIGVRFDSDTTYGFVPFTVNFSGMSGLTVDTWDWEFGDGDTGSGQNPSHTYTSPGLYNVTLEIDASGDIRYMTRNNYIVGLADTLEADPVLAAPGSQVEVLVYAKNNVPLRSIKIPVEHGGGPFSLTLADYSTEGCRTADFEEVSLAHWDGGGARFTLRLKSSDYGTTPDLPAGEGLICKIYFNVSASAGFDEIAPIVIDGYTSGSTEYVPEFYSATAGILYSAANLDGQVQITGCCIGNRGNVDGDAEDNVDISDLLYYVDYAFGFPAGPAPVCVEEADFDLSGSMDISDILFLVDYMFGSPAGPAPPSCN